jgi:hypothetical protein
MPLHVHEEFNLVFPGVNARGVFVYRAGSA